jgi:hypothetical protein
VDSAQPQRRKCECEIGEAERIYGRKRLTCAANAQPWTTCGRVLSVEVREAQECRVSEWMLREDVRLRWIS